MKRIILLVICSSIANLHAVVPTIDVNIQANDRTTMALYSSSVASTMSHIQQSMSPVEQLKNLQGLQKLSSTNNLCQLCTQEERQQLYAYAKSVNDDLCNQFSMAYKNIAGVEYSATSLQQVMGFLTTNPSAAMLALQQATIVSIQTTNSILTQMQLLQTQALQKELAKEKLQSTVSKDVGQSMADIKW